MIAAGEFRDGHRSLEINNHRAGAATARPGSAVSVGLYQIQSLIHRLSRDRVDARPQAKQEQRETKAGEEALEPTLLALRHEVEGGRDPVLVGTTGAGIRHYRVKDAESELRY